jgi:hypothetical protein
MGNEAQNAAISEGSGLDSDAGQPLATPVGQCWAMDSDPIEAALARALEGATAAAQWSLVGELARQLEERKRERERR